ncbi:hypothetical protein ACQPX6_25395 [Actinomycetospora sp. CA-101289]|uniref:hypothetical protein n=1 Tax=Actinomycetospora sp. CA-101289 TaxID=3239893 RepID=UPI003D983AEB
MSDPGFVADLGQSFDRFLGHGVAEGRVLLVVDRAAGAVHAYGPYGPREIGPALAAMREQLRHDGIEDVEVYGVPLHPPGEL